MEYLIALRCTLQNPSEDLGKAYVDQKLIERLPVRAVTSCQHLFGMKSI